MNSGTFLHKPPKPKPKPKHTCDTPGWLERLLHNVQTNDMWRCDECQAVWQWQTRDYHPYRMWNRVLKGK